MNSKRREVNWQSKDVEAELILRFRVRPAGWIGNDSWSAELPLRLLKVIRATARLILKGDERLSEVRWRWRRDGDKSWRDEQVVPEDVA